MDEKQAMIELYKTLVTIEQRKTSFYSGLFTILITVIATFLLIHAFIWPKVPEPNHPEYWLAVAIVYPFLLVGYLYFRFEIANGEVRAHDGWTPE